MSQLEQRGRRDPSYSESISLSILVIRPSTDWTRPTHTEEGNLLYSVSRFKCQPHPEIHGIMFAQMSGAPWPVTVIREISLAHTYTRGCVEIRQPRVAGSACRGASVATLIPWLCRMCLLLGAAVHCCDAWFWGSRQPRERSCATQASH